MKLYEDEAKNIFRKYLIQVPYGATATTSKKARSIATRIGKEVAVKAQVLVSGRGKAGGIKFSKTADEIEKTAQDLLSIRIKDAPVKKLLIEERLSIKRELYFAITVDRFNRCYVAIASAIGGIDIEDIANRGPKQIFRLLIDPEAEFGLRQAKEIAENLGYSKNQLLVLSEIFVKIFQIVMDYDAEMVEINPLAETIDGKFVAADARIIIDDNALYRHPEFAEKNLLEQRELTLQEAEARKKGIEYLKLEGDIGVIGNGAGLVMATLDMINFYGGKPADFIDIGGGASAQKIATAIETVLSDSAVKVLFVNILGGITRCDEVAYAIVEIKNKLNAVPFIVRLMGTNEQKGKRILSQANIYIFDSMEEAAQKAVQLAEQEA